MHLDEEQLQRLLHGELGPSAERRLRAHLAECIECRDRLVAAERDEGEILGLLRQVDHPLPEVSAEAIAARALGKRVEWGRWAAGILLLLGMAGAAYALPGSPLREWVWSVVEWTRQSGRPAREPSQAEAADDRVAGVAAVPGRSFVIAFESPEPEGQARVSLTDAEEVTVRAPIGAARFTSAADRLVIANAGVGAVFVIGIPRTAPWIEIRVSGNRIFLKDGKRIVTQSSTDSKGDYLLPLSRP